MLRRLLFALFLAGFAALPGGAPVDARSPQCEAIASERHPVTGFPPRAPNGWLNILVEIPAGTNVKWEVDKESGNLRRETEEGKPRVVRYLPYPANYGMIPGTLWPKSEGGDGDPLDVVLLGPAVCRGDVVPGRLIGVLKLLDGGEADDKLITVAPSGPLGKVGSLAQLDQAFPGVTRILRIWFSHYKGSGKIKIVGYAERDEAERILDAAHAAFESLEESR